MFKTYCIETNNNCFTVANLLVFEIMLTINHNFKIHRVNNSLWECTQTPIKLHIIFDFHIKHYFWLKIGCILYFFEHVKVVPVKFNENLVFYT